MTFLEGRSISNNAHLISEEKDALPIFDIELRSMMLEEIPNENLCVRCIGKAYKSSLNWDFTPAFGDGKSIIVRVHNTAGYRCGSRDCGCEWPSHEGLVEAYEATIRLFSRMGYKETVRLFKAALEYEREIISRRSLTD